jgi:nitrite reductase/ring-hydroxylating ferredoxin subunit
MGWTDYPSAPPAGTPVCRADAVSGVKTCVITTAAGNFPLLLLRGALGLRAYVNACPHQYLPLDYRSQNLLSADGAKLLCSAHGAEFDAETGSVLAGADCGLDAVPVIEADGMILIDPACLDRDPQGRT